MKQFLTDPKRKARLDWVLDAFSLGAVLQYCAYRFLQSTMFNFYYSQTYKMVTMGLLLVFGGIRYLYIIIGKWKEKNKEEKKKFALYCIGAWLLALPFFYVGWLHDYKFLIFLPICCMCLYDMDAGKICRWFAFTISVLLAATVLCCLSGTVRNLVRTLADGRVVCAYGTVNTTDFASYFTFLLLIVWCGVRRYEWYIDTLFAVVAIVGSYIIFQITDSRTALYIGIIITAVCLWESIRKYVKQKNGRDIGKKLEWLPVITFPAIGIIVLILSVAYGAGVSWAVQLDNGVLTHRLETTINPYSTYGISAFGSSIHSMHGMGGTIHHDWSAGYSYIDIAYAMLTIRYGWVITGIIAALWMWLTLQALRTGNERTAFALMILAIQGFSEARILDVNYNVFLIMPFCAMKGANREKKNRSLSSVIICGVSCGGFYIILPRLLSLMRTYFAVKEWNNGLATVNAFFVCVVTILTFGFLMKFLSRCAVGKLDRRTVGIMFVSIMMIAVVAHDYIHSIGEEKGSATIKADRQIVDKVQNVATQPVYIAEYAELFRAEGVTIKDHLFSTEELKRTNGSIFVDSSVEALGITLSGGLYTQISDWTGLYSYDPSVVDLLKSEGSNWTSYYSGQRTANLFDIAVVNNLQMKNNALLLQGPKRIQINSVETDQITGTYEVSLAMKLKSELKEGGCIFEVVGEAGERVLYQEEISSKDFDADGVCKKIITYSIISTPKVSYSIILDDEVTVYFDYFSWKRIS